MDEEQSKVFMRKNINDEQTTDAIETILYMVCSLTAGQDQATIQAGCTALASMIRVEHKAYTNGD